MRSPAGRQAFQKPTLNEAEMERFFLFLLVSFQFHQFTKLFLLKNGMCRWLLLNYLAYTFLCIYLLNSLATYNIMKYIFIFFLTFIVINDTYAQNSSDFFKAVPIIDNNTPEWARLMYSENPNVGEVEHLFKQYYKNNEFVKNIIV